MSGLGRVDGQPSALVIGYGNPYRRDDGTGWHVAGQLDRLKLPGVRVVRAHQLMPELAEELARSRLAVFVDACIGPHDGPVVVRPVRPGPPPALAHTWDPPGLLTLARELFRSDPIAWTVAISGHDFGTGCGLSQAARTAARQALGEIKRLVAEGQPIGSES